MADQVGWSTLSKIVLWTSVAFVILYIVMSGIYWRQYVAAKTIDPNGEIVSLWASFPLFTFLWSFVILGFVLFLLWRAHTTDVIFTAAAGVGTFLSQGYAERFGPNREAIQRHNTIKEASRGIELARAASKKAIENDKIVKTRTEDAVGKASDELNHARKMRKQEQIELNKNNTKILAAKWKYENAPSLDEKSKIGLELADLEIKEASIKESIQKTEADIELKNRKLEAVQREQQVAIMASTKRREQASIMLANSLKNLEALSSVI
jgi:hypothetical protein